MISFKNLESFPWKLTDFVVDPVASVPTDIVHKIYTMHMLPMVQVQARLNAPIWASQQSCFRNKKYERKKGRTPEKTASGRWSTHTFDKDVTPDGACDWTTIPEKYKQLGIELVFNSGYKRIAMYDDQNFYHGDYFGGNPGKYVLDPTQRKYYTHDWKELSMAEFFKRMYD